MRRNTESLILPRDFYYQPVQTVARALLGMKLVRRINGKNLAGVITETEAYDGEHDLACHARSGRTTRNEVMYGQSGHAYVYFTYGMHWMLNCVTGEEGYPSAALIRAILPIVGQDIIGANRKGVKEPQWCNGPAKMTRALSITGDFNGADLCDPKSNLVICEGTKFMDEQVSITPRIGIQNTPEPWLSKPWRYLVNYPQFTGNEI
ncbi:MAG TPA: DNA-3-methyladenine glycosylase [Pelolinea sp.]|nr:DNA-3-methyladenine glycosylase [Pelolinea sp.]